MQSVIPATYPILKENFNLNFTQIGLITFVYQLTALLQPFIGFYTDKTKTLLIGNWYGVYHF
jgi:FSR family fosmidomycin resistance protein-like MFS transporter